MTLAQAAATLGTTPKWIQNALAQLRLPLVYGEVAMRRLDLARRLVNLGLTLQAAWDWAGWALRSPHRPALLSSDGSPVALTIDVPRFLTEWSAAVSRTVASGPSPGRGRPRKPPRRGGVAAAEAWGIDVNGLRNNLRKTPAERLRTLDANQRFLARLRTRRS
jgi:hypothetical protein